MPAPPIFLLRDLHEYLLDWAENRPAALPANTVVSANDHSVTLTNAIPAGDYHNHFLYVRGASNTNPIRKYPFFVKEASGNVVELLHPNNFRVKIGAGDTAIISPGPLATSPIHFKNAVETKRNSSGVRNEYEFLVGMDEDYVNRHTNSPMERASTTIRTVDVGGFVIIDRITGKGLGGTHTDYGGIEAVVFQLQELVYRYTSPGSSIKVGKEMNTEYFEQDDLGQTQQEDKGLVECAITYFNLKYG